MQIVIAWKDENNMPFALLWTNSGDGADIVTAEAYAKKRELRVFIYSGLSDPKARAKRDVM